jgi:hypothetical protein
MSMLASRLVGRPLAFLANDVHTIPTDRKARTETPQSTIGTWIGLRSKADKADLRLGAVLRKDLNRQGRDSDVRRQWNKDRGLRVRANLPKDEKARIESELESAIDERDARIDGLIAESNPGRDMQAWCDRLYDDACDIPSADVDRIDIDRVLRAVGWEDLVYDRSLVVYVLEMIEDLLISVNGGRFYDDHFGAAYAATRGNQAGYEFPKARRRGSGK